MIHLWNLLIFPPPPKAHLLRYKIDEIRVGLVKGGNEYGLVVNYCSYFSTIFLDIFLFLLLKTFICGIILQFKRQWVPYWEAHCCLI